jgi:glycerate-2-kinase
MELALAAAIKIRSLEGVALGAMGTDGLDGPTDAAGAVVDGRTIERGLRVGVRAEAALRENDSYHYFAKEGGLIRTGPTYTNVNDVVVLVAT